MRGRHGVYENNSSNCHTLLPVKGCQLVRVAIPLERGLPAKGRYIHTQFVARTFAFAGKPRSNSREERSCLIPKHSSPAQAKRQLGKRSGTENPEIRDPI